MIYGYVGLMGQGKTYGATREALKALKKGAKVLANYHIEGCEYAHTWDDVLEATIAFGEETKAAVEEGKPRPRLMVVIDEANLWCPSRFWQKLDPRLLYFWAQSRKLGLDIVYTAQHEARVDTALREITYMLWHCKRVGPFFVYRAYLPEEIRKQKRYRMGFRCVYKRRYVMAAYDTFQLVDLGQQILKGEEGPSHRDPDMRITVAPEIKVNGRKRGLIRR